MESAQTDRKLFGLSGRALGLVLIFLTAIIWVAASFVSQLLVNTEEGKPSFNVSPFLLTYLSTSIFSIFLPLVQLRSLLQETWLLRRSFKYKALTEEEDTAAFASPTASVTDQGQQADGYQQSHQQQQPQDTDRLLSEGGLAADLDMAEAAAAAEQASAAARASAAAHKESLLAAAQCFALWFTAQYLFNKSLSLTSVTSNTILSSTSSLFTFALSMIVLKEPYSMAKLLSIAACIGGTLLVTLSDDDSSKSSSVSSPAAMGGNSIHSTIAANTTAVPAAAAGSFTGPSHSVLGDLLCLISACFYASYTIVLRKSLPDEDEANVALFFGYIGLLCSVVFAPVVAVLAGLGTMHLKSIPPKAYLIILIEGILNYCLSDYLWAHAVLLLGPTIATLGLSVQIPVAAVVEVIIGVPKWLSNGRSMAMMLCGTALIMLGFFAGNLAGGGRVYGSHHRGDTDADERHRRSSAADDVFADDADDDFYDLSFTNGDVVIPVSTHASVGLRVSSPTLGSGSNHSNGTSNGRVLGTQPQQQRHSGSPARSPARKGGYDAVSSEVDDGFLQQRTSVELSSLGSSVGSNRSTPSSVRNATVGPSLSPTAVDGRTARVAAALVSPMAVDNGTTPQQSGDDTELRAGTPKHEQQQPWQEQPEPQQQSTSPAAGGRGSPVQLRSAGWSRLGQQSKAGHYSDKHLGNEEG